MHIHILGVCGTFMAGIAVLARAAGHTVTGSDAAAWPPMSTQLEAQGITVMAGYEPSHLQPAPDMVVVGNVVTRGNPAMEYVLNAGLPYISGPQWLSEYVLQQRHVLAVAGTHGKTSTSAMLAWILDVAGLEPGFLIGGVPQNFGISARLGNSKYFVVEADEYDTAFFDKRSKFVHYRPRTAILNNLEFDHADIFPDLAAIERQFHHLVRTVPSEGHLIVNGRESALQRVLKQGAWSELRLFGVPEGWHYVLNTADGSVFDAYYQGTLRTTVHWACVGEHNVMNALAAIAAAESIGIAPDTAAKALSTFQNVKRRLELRGEVRGVRVYDDFAHHPTAIAATVGALRARESRQGRIIAVLEPRSNTMRLGTHSDELVGSLADADLAFLFQRADLQWDARPIIAGLGERGEVLTDMAALVAKIVAIAQPNDQILVMSNGDFGGIHGKILAGLAA